MTNPIIRVSRCIPDGKEAFKNSNQLLLGMNAGGLVYMAGSSWPASDGTCERDGNTLLLQHVRVDLKKVRKDPLTQTNKSTRSSS